MTSRYIVTRFNHRSGSSTSLADIALKTLRHCRRPVRTHGIRLELGPAGNEDETLAAHGERRGGEAVRIVDRRADDRQAYDVALQVAGLPRVVEVPTPHRGARGGDA